MSEIGDLECFVCFQEYEETGDLVPRILPCHDTVCERCIKQLLGEGGTLKCPVCRKQFNADEGFKKFHQNKYIMSQLKKKEKESRVQCCKTHALVPSLYCKDCGNDICTMCLSENHRKHDVVDVNYMKRGKCVDVLKSANHLVESLTKDVKELLKMREELATDAEDCFDRINSQKERVLEIFERKTNTVILQCWECTGTITELVSKINETMVSLKQTIEDVDVDSGKLTLEMISDKQERITEIKKNIQQCLPQKQSFTSLKYKLNNPKQVEEICGKFVKVEKVVQMKTVETKKRSQTPAKDRHFVDIYLDLPKDLLRCRTPTDGLPGGTPTQRNQKFVRRPTNYLCGFRRSPDLMYKCEY